MTDYYERMIEDDIIFNAAKEYNKQLIAWLISRGFIPKNRNIKILDAGSGKGFFYFALKYYR
jgi:hypothetical protein